MVFSFYVVLAGHIEEDVESLHFVVELVKPPKSEVVAFERTLKIPARRAICRCVQPPNVDAVEVTVELKEGGVDEVVSWKVVDEHGRKGR